MSLRGQKNEYFFNNFPSQLKITYYTSYAPETSPKYHIKDAKNNMSKQDIIK